MNKKQTWSLKVERQVPMYARITKGGGNRISDLQIRFRHGGGLQIEQAGHWMSSRFNFFPLKREVNRK